MPDLVLSKVHFFNHKGCEDVKEKGGNQIDGDAFKGVNICK
jgi:hypothetical protein